MIKKKPHQTQNNLSVQAMLTTGVNVNKDTEINNWSTKQIQIKIMALHFIKPLQQSKATTQHLLLISV